MSDGMCACRETNQCNHIRIPAESSSIGMYPFQEEDLMVEAKIREALGSCKGVV